MWSLSSNIQNFVASFRKSGHYQFWNLLQIHWNGSLWQKQFFKCEETSQFSLHSSCWQRGVNREGKKECLEYGHSKLNRNNKKTRKMFCPLWLNTAWIVSFEVLIIINFGRKESQMVHVLVQSSHKLLIQRSLALHELGITLDWVKYSEHIHFFAHGNSMFLQNFFPSATLFFWYGMNCNNEDATKGPSIYYVLLTGFKEGWVGSKKLISCWRSVMHFYWHSGWVQIVQKCTDVLYGWSLCKKECRSQIIFHRQTYLVDGPQGHHQNSHQKICYTQTEDQIVGHTLKVALQDDSRNNKYISCKK